MRHLARASTVLRRTLIVVLLAVLSVHYVKQWGDSRGRGINDPMSELQGDGPVTAIPVGKSFRIDEDLFTADDFYATSKTMLVTYTYRAKQTRYSWSFPSMSLKLVTPDGEQLIGRSSGSNGTAWGERGYVTYDMPDRPPERVKLVYDVYDRYGEIEIPLAKAGEGT